MRATLNLPLLLCCFFALASLQVRAASCSISTASVAFGVYDSLGIDRRDTIGTITVNCTGLVGEVASYSILLDTSGQHGSYRVMANGVHELVYIIYIDNTYTRVWGDGATGSTFVNDSYMMATSQTSRSYPLYGRIPAGQKRATAGVYGTNLTVTLNY